MSVEVSILILQRMRFARGNMRCIRRHVFSFLMIAVVSLRHSVVSEKRQVETRAMCKDIMCVETREGSSCPYRSCFYGYQGRRDREEVEVPYVQKYHGF
jgi:hypothetical protein